MTPDERAEALADKIAPMLRDGASRSDGVWKWTKEYCLEALRDERRRAMEEAAKLVCPYCNDPAWTQRDCYGEHLSPVTGSVFLCKAQAIREQARRDAASDPAHPSTDVAIASENPRPLS